MFNELFELEIDLGQERDNDDLMLRYSACSKALSDFLALKISFSDYCDILSFYGVEIDEYLGIIEENLQECPLSLV